MMSIFSLGKHLRKKELELILESIPEIPKPKASLEQYTIPGRLAAQILWDAYFNGDIEDRIVFDLGSGTGRLAIGAALLGARYVIGVDIDITCHKIAMECIKRLKITNIELVQANIPFIHFKSNVENSVVVQNPPFGVHRRHADLIFLYKAFSLAKVVYSIHKYSEDIDDFIKRKALECGFIITWSRRDTFELPARLNFHTKRIERVPIKIYRFERRP